MRKRRDRLSGGPSFCRSHQETVSVLIIVFEDY